LQGADYVSIQKRPVKIERSRKNYKNKVATKKTILQQKPCLAISRCRKIAEQDFILLRKG
jgi:hypothetical protein